MFLLPSWSRSRPQHVMRSKIIFKTFRRYPVASCEQQLIVFQSAVRECISFRFMQNTHICLTFPQLWHVLCCIAYSSVHYAVQSLLAHTKFWGDTVPQVTYLDVYWVYKKSSYSRWQAVVKTEQMQHHRSRRMLSSRGRDRIPQQVSQYLWPLVQIM